MCSDVFAQITRAHSSSFFFLRTTMSAKYDTNTAKSFIVDAWDAHVVPTLCKYIEIPNQSPLFDPEWASNGHMDAAVDLLVQWTKEQNVAGLKLEVVRLEGRTPLIFIEVDATADASDRTVLLYGHLDKQPPLTDTWAEGLHPYKPVIKDGKLYGRGGADDGYSIFAAVLGIKALQEQGVGHSRCVIVVEACEESGSPDLPYYIEHLKERIGSPGLIVCLDSGCGNYEQFWLTTSLRGIVVGNLTVNILSEGVHSGAASGVVPSSFRILRSILSRLEDEKTGQILPDEFHVEIPAQRLEQAKACAAALGDSVWDSFPFVDGAGPTSTDATELLLRKTWRPQLSITGVDGMPTLVSAGNVLRTHTAVKISLRVPPTANAPECSQALKALLEDAPPYGAKVTYDGEKAGSGWEAPPLAPWLKDTVEEASQTFFDKPSGFIGEGGSIPFMGMLGKMFPEAQFVITGVLGPKSNAHGPNEFLHINQGKMVTACVSYVLQKEATL